MSQFCCPLCGDALAETLAGLRCPGGHCFDRAREGYVNLLPVNRKHSKTPGDDKGMVAARRAFLEKGWYQPLRETLQALAVKLTGPAPAVLDAGCGEGYYTGGVRRALEDAGKAPRFAGIDISKAALQKAGKRYPGIEFAVASAYRLPVPDGSVELLLNVFSPLAIEEFRRVMRPGGVYLYVVPGAKHLWELKETLYERPYPNDEKETPYEGFAYERIVPVNYRIHLLSQRDIHALFQMTPYYWKTSKEGAQRLAEAEEMDCQIDFKVHVFRRSGD